MPEELAAERDKAKAAREARRKAASAAAEEAGRQWASAVTAQPSHPYLVAKGIKPHGLRQDGDDLLISACDVAGKIRTLQRIYPNGRKRNLTDGAKTGHYYAIGKPGPVICIGEGFATMATVHEATGLPCVVAFDCGNLSPVTVALSAEYPDALLILCADDDHKTPGNPGLTHARRAARSVPRAVVAVPVFGSDQRDDQTDFNDMRDHAAVLAAIDLAKDATMSDEPGPAYGYEPMGNDPDTVADFEKAHAGRNRAKAEGPKPLISATPFPYIDPTKIPPVKWLYDRHYVRDFITATVATGGIGKSTLVLTDAIGMASGRNLLAGSPTAPRRCWYIGGEDPRVDLHRRAAAIMKHHGVTHGHLGGSLMLDSGRDVSIRLATTQRGEVMLNTELIDALKNTIRANSIDAVILDPFITTHSVAENDNTAMQQIMDVLKAMADELHIGIELVHHTRKTGGNEATAEDARGASVVVAAARAVRTVRQMTPDEAKKAGVENHRAYIRVNAGAKQNLAPAHNAVTWRQFIGVDLGNATAEDMADNKGVLVAWNWPDVFGDVTKEQVNEVLRAVGVDGDWKLRSNGKPWVGECVADVLDLDTGDPADKDKIKTMLKTWLKNGQLRVVQRQDATRQKRQFVEMAKCID